MISEPRLIYRPTDVWPTYIRPDRLEVMDVERDDAARRPALKVYVFRNSPDQSYWELVDDRQLSLWYVADPTVESQKDDQ